MNSEEIEILGEEEHKDITKENKIFYKEYLYVWLILILSIATLVYMCISIKQSQYLIYWDFYLKKNRK